MLREDYEELYLASVRVPLVLAIFLGLWGLVLLVLQALQIDYASVLSKASGESISPVLPSGKGRTRRGNVRSVWTASCGSVAGWLPCRRPRTLMRDGVVSSHYCVSAGVLSCATTSPNRVIAARETRRPHTLHRKHGTLQLYVAEARSKILRVQEKSFHPSGRRRPGTSPLRRNNTHISTPLHFSSLLELQIIIVCRTVTVVSYL